MPRSVENPVRGLCPKQVYWGLGGGLREPVGTGWPQSWDKNSGNIKGEIFGSQLFGLLLYP